MMNRIVQKTTQKFIDLLPENEQYYRLDELSAWGFPPYIVQRTKVELERNMAESMILPDTDWANVESEAVQHAWQKFVQAIRAEARLPASYARAVIETAVADVLDMLTEPRENIPDVIYGGDRKLTFEELSQRVEAVVVYPHFAALVPRYMQKKNRNTLSREECAELIARADQKLTAKYSPLNWAQTLAPLFELMDGQIEPVLLRRFFEDKEMQKIADVFDRMDDPLNRAEFIEKLSSPDLPSTRSPVPDAGEREEKQPDRSSSTAEMTDDTTAGDYLDEPEPEEAEEPAPQTAEEAGPHGKWAGEGFEKTEDTENDVEVESPEESREEPEVDTQEEASPAEEFSFRDDDFVKPDREGVERLSEEDTAPAATDEDQSEEDEEYREPDETEEPEETPIWMSFVDEEDQAELEFDDEEEYMPADFGPSPEEDPSEDSPVNESTLDFEKEMPEQKSVANPLEQRLSDEREYFVEEIFGGSEENYENALDRMSDLNDWDSASDFIHNEIFVRNLVNLYSEPAVDFTNRMQNYFKEKHN